MTVLEGILWLTLNVYHEARSESEQGQVAVAHVTLNRARELNMSVKDVVTQPYQFSWTFQKKTYMPDDPQAFFSCMHSAYLALKNKDFTSGATYYHLDNINPTWAAEKVYINQFGSHKFYKDKPKSGTPSLPGTD